MTTGPWYAKSNIDTLLALKAPLASPTFTGTPAVPTATAGTNTAQAASTAFVAAAVAAGGGGTKPIYRGISRTAGDYTITATTPSAIDSSGAIDITIPAAVGNLLQITMNAQANTGTVTIDFNVAIINGSGATIRTYAAGTGTIGGWTLRSADYFGTSGTIAMPVIAGDLTGSNVILRLLAKVGSSSRTLFANTATPLIWHAINLG